MSAVRVSVIAILLFTLGAGSAAALPKSAKITTAGLGAVKIGMTERQVEKAAKRAITREGDLNGCSSAKLGDKVFGLFTGNRLARIYVNSRRYATKSGLRVGATEAQVRAAYGSQVVVRRHKYDPNGHYMEIRDGNRKVVFVTDGSKVGEISTGRLPEIDYVEGCA
jgi:hypothetical protein